MYTVESTVENKSKSQKRWKESKNAEVQQLKGKKTTVLLICRESKRCRTWCRSKYVQQSCVELEQRLVEAVQAGAVTPMINSLPAT